MGIPDFCLSDGLKSGRPAFDPSLFVSPADLIQKIKSDNPPLMVDVRLRQDFDAVHIPGSLNLSLYAVKTKALFKTKDLVLFNEGYDNHLLMEECRNLRQLGFKASILHGGLTSWEKNKGLIEGDFFAGSKKNKMPPSVLSREKEFNNWILIDASAKPDPEIKTLLPQAVSMPSKMDQKFLHKQIAVMPQNNLPFFSVLIFNETGEGYEKIEKSLSEMPNIFFLEKGLNGYKEFLRNQALLQHKNKKQVSTKPINKCATCP
jgi:rhodanese-related sulfurtransferase